MKTVKYKNEEMTEAELYKKLGKRRPEFVKPYIALLTKISETDENRVVRIHAKGSVKATMDSPN